MICYAISHYKIINFIANYLFVNILIYMIIKLRWLYYQI